MYVPSLQLDIDIRCPSSVYFLPHSNVLFLLRTIFFIVCHLNMMPEAYKYLQFSFILYQEHLHYNRVILFLKTLIIYHRRVVKTPWDMFLIILFRCANVLWDAVPIHLLALHCIWLTDWSRNHAGGLKIVKINSS